MKNKDMIKELSIGDLFRSNDSYLIPIYQRNYAWGKSEVEQLLTDINDYAVKNIKQDYYIGTLVVFQKNINGKTVFETIDGQQRLTTLSILLSVLKNEFDNQLTFDHLLKYESRKISTNTLNHIYNGDIEEQENLNFSMENAYNILKNAIKKIDLKVLKEFLLNNVKILRVDVPKDTDLNHYFEIMNNRGEQLEKHEVLKARMLKILTNDNDKKVFNNIWEACSDMYRYVQYGFSPSIRTKVFGKEWNSLVLQEFSAIVEAVFSKKEDDENSNTEVNKKECDFTIDNILNGKCEFKDNGDNKKNSDKPDRFTSPINFSNFLLHVLKITKDKNVPLDDKRLLDTFDYDDEDFVKNFGYNLLKIRFLLDNYVIKREYTADEVKWRLRQYKTEQKNIQYKNRFSDEKINKQILMILSMFHVSNPSPIYKYWLTGVLNYLFINYKNGICEDNYLRYLESLANKFFKRHLSTHKIDYNDLIFEPCSFSYVIDKNILDQGTSVEHFIFNYLDYLLWRKNLDGKRNFNYFSFSFSNSVEHFYPQNPIEGHDKLKDKIDDFGNLCLMSVSKNAKLNNHPPKSKKEYYPNNQYDSLKQHIMMEKADSWNEKAIQNHKDEMLNVLEKGSVNA